MAFVGTADRTNLFYKDWDSDHDVLADNLHAMLQSLDLSDVTLVGVSMGGARSPAPCRGTAADLRAFDKPTPVVHGLSDTTAPIHASGRRTAAMIHCARLIEYEGAPPGLFHTERKRRPGTVTSPG